MHTNTYPGVDSMATRKFQLRAELRLKNARLVEAREKLGMNQRQFAEHVGINYYKYNGYETMRSFPSDEHQAILSICCLCSAEELFPPALKKYAEGDSPRVLTSVAEIDPNRLLHSVSREALMLPAKTTPEDDFSAGDLVDELKKALTHLTPREAKILILYFGLEGEEPRTLGEICPLVDDISIVRVRQIKEKALSKLRHASISRRLEEFLRTETPRAGDPREGLQALHLRRLEEDRDLIRRRAFLRV